MITVQHLTKSFGRQTVVSDVSFTLGDGSFTALIGPNGAGKTTILSMLAGLLKPTKGTVNLEGIKDIRKEIGFLPQYPQFYPWLTGLEFIEMTAKLSGISARDTRKEAVKVLEFVGLKDVMHKKTAQYSGGMKQRLGIAQAIVHKPKLLLLDEPVASLDPVGRREIMNLLKQLQLDSTILYSTHILNDAEEMTDQLLFLKKGQVVEKGSLNEIREKFDVPRIRIQFSKIEEAIGYASQSKWSTEVEGMVVYIHITDHFPTMQQVMEELSNSPFTVLKIERNRLTLEEIFMKVVSP
ncbi:ABC transporter ATP-binding protein [Ureibacillus thermophilus]|uniref:ABC transporter ATP-binding protein n=1 Tax=Ureibacillus thermophilus TaxID=367743 RepID=A0A4P6URE5_9BACL|nr:ABC transporter ATP-binding protein [Ureibacillus thermophilus]QBK24468.1 ABC transporter ATP-binding protein [Ureibacillus thermophilus]